MTIISAKRPFIKYVRLEDGGVGGGGGLRPETVHSVCI